VASITLGILLETMIAAAVSPGAGPPECRPLEIRPAAREHVENIESRSHTYNVTMGGTLDGFNTVEYLDTYGHHMRQKSKFEPNDYVVLENTGEVDVVNPWIIVAGRRDWFSAQTILSGILQPGMTDAEKAMAIWKFTSGIEVQGHDNNRRVGPPYTDDRSNPSRNTFQERANPVKAANCYYCSGCSLSAANYVVLARRAGLPARAVWMCPMDTYATHCVAEAWYAGGWHLFDPERRSFYLEADNSTVASYETLHKNPLLAVRTHDGGFAGKGMKSHAADYKEFYPPHVMPVEQWLSTMAMTLRPGEKFIWRWDHVGKYRCGDNRRNIRPDRPDGILPYQLANGKMAYRPKLAGSAFWHGVVSAMNVKPVRTKGNSSRLYPEVAAAPGWAIYKISSPYPIVGGLVGGKFLRKTDRDGCRILVSASRSDWTEVWTAEKTGQIEQYVQIDGVLNPKPTPAIYHYYVKFELTAAAETKDAALLEACIETDVQMAATALPSLSVGRNEVVCRHESPAGARIRVVHGWRESSDDRPPLPPIGPVTPDDGARVAASPERLTWKEARHPDGRPIADYHVQLSPRPDMLHPVSPNFDRIIFSAKPEWVVPQGWLLAGRTYYWRVRAQDEWGAWSGWSPVWKFTVGQAAVADRP